MGYLADGFFAELLSAVNVIFALLLAGYNVRQVRVNRGFLRIFSIISVVIGLYWAGLYTFVILTPAGAFDSATFGRVFVRPAFAFTLAMMASVALFRNRTRL